MAVMEPSEKAAETFQALRPGLFRLAYRMLGSVAEAEDLIQDAFLRWWPVAVEDIRTPEAYLRRVVTRLCLDRLKSARHRHELYVGTWLPDPVMEVSDDGTDNITLPLMLVLERLSPLERAAFLLYDVFGTSFEEIAETLGRTPASCRQLASRARVHVRAQKPRYPIGKEHCLQYARAFFEASRKGELKVLRKLLAADVAVYADGGAKVSASRDPIVGLEAVLDLHLSLARIFAEHGSVLVRLAMLNGLPGFLSIEQEDVFQTTALRMEGEKIAAVYVTRNPDKLNHLRGFFATASSPARAAPR